MERSTSGPVRIYNKGLETIVELRGNYHCNRHLQAAWNKYGGQNFDFVILVECGLKECADNERRLIASYQSCDREHGYNIASDPNGSMIGRTHTEETKAHLRKVHAGTKPSQKCVDAAASATRGKPRPQEVRDKIGNGHRGRKCTEESKEIMRQNHWRHGPNADEISARMEETKRQKRLADPNYARKSDLPPKPVKQEPTVVEDGDKTLFD